MTVYVDEITDYGERALSKGLPTSLWAHMTADTREELHDMAKLLGIRRWFQDHRVHWHYDLTPRLRERAIELGAVPITDRDMGRMMYERRKNLR